jgi:hypothetical protein
VFINGSYEKLLDTLVKGSPNLSLAS